jgi:hypothetical protein
MHLAPAPRALPDTKREQFLFLDKTLAKVN